MSLPKYAVIVAGGRGVRMKRSTPKQFLPLAGQPVLMHTITAFHHCPLPIEIIVVLPDAEIATWKELCQRYTFKVDHKVVAGGATRSASVYQGLQHVSDGDGLVAVHDGVRPLVTIELIERSFQLAEKHGSAVASVPLKDSIRKVSGSSSESCSREQYRLVQTPQTFRTAWLRKAYEMSESVFSDDASLVEHSGPAIHLIEGEYRNIKITTPEDLIVVAALLSKATARRGVV